MRDDLDKLISRLEAATGPALVLDGGVWCAVNGYEYVSWDGAGCVYRKGDSTHGISHASAREIRPYTASLDATIALVERLTGNASWRVGNLRPWADPKAGFATLGTDTTTHEAATPAIALLIALLQTLRSRHD